MNYISALCTAPCFMKDIKLSAINLFPKDLAASGKD